MEVTSGSEEAFVREWTPCSHILSLIPPRLQNGLFSNELFLTCVDAVSEYIALGTNMGLVYWYDRKKGNIQRLRCEASTSPITFVKIVNTVDFMVGAGNEAGQVTVFQIPKEHPENVPDTFKPKVEPKVERYTIGDLHKSRITAIEWSKNGMRLFSGDRNGLIIMTEIDFYMHLCKSMEIVNEEHEIVQMSYHTNTLLVSSVYRTIVCTRANSGKWAVEQLGKKERRSLSPLGCVFVYSYAVGGDPTAYCARPGLRLWRADKAGNVLQTLIFKEAVANPLTVAELLNPAQRKRPALDPDYNFGPLHVFREHFLVAHNHHILYILDPRSLTAVAVVDDLRNILSVSVHKEEIFILEGGRSLVRLAHAPDPAHLTEDKTNPMTKSLTSSLQQAVNTVRDLTIPPPYLTMLEPLSLFRNDVIDTATVAGEHSFNLPPVKNLPKDISDNVLESIINEFKDNSEAEEIRRIKSEEIEKKFKLYSSIMEKKYDEEVIHSSRRSRRGGSGNSTPRQHTPVRRATPSDVSITTPCVMNVSVYGNQPEENDDLLEKQIEEKEKILAKMLNLESLSIKQPENLNHRDEQGDFITEYNKKNTIAKPASENMEPFEKPPTTFEIRTENGIKDNNKKFKKESVDLIPKVVQLPNTWNLENIELKLEQSNGIKKAHNLISPDETIDADWEIV